MPCIQLSKYPDNLRVFKKSQLREKWVCLWSLFTWDHLAPLECPAAQGHLINGDSTWEPSAQAPLVHAGGPLMPPHGCLMGSSASTCANPNLVTLISSSQPCACIITPHLGICASKLHPSRHSDKNTKTPPTNKQVSDTLHHKTETNQIHNFSLSWLLSPKPHVQ